MVPGDFTAASTPCEEALSWACWLKRVQAAGSLKAVGPGPGDVERQRNLGPSVPAGGFKPRELQEQECLAKVDEELRWAARGCRAFFGTPLNSR